MALVPNAEGGVFEVRLAGENDLLARARRAVFPRSPSSSSSCATASRRAAISGTSIDDRLMGERSALRSHGGAGRRPGEELDARRRVRGRGAPAAPQRREPAVHPPLGGRDAGRALGHRRDRRQRDPDRRRGDSGRGRGRHRLRNDRGAHESCARDLPDDLEGHPQRDRESGAARADAGPAGAARSRRVGPRAAARRGRLGAARARLRADLREAPGAAQQPTTRPISARSAPAITSSRCASTRPIASGSCSTAARAASATRSAAISSSSRNRTCASTWPTCPTRISPICARARRHFADYVEAVEWAQTFAADEPRDHDGRGDPRGAEQQGDPAVRARRSRR